MHFTPEGIINMKEWLKDMSEEGEDKPTQEVNMLISACFFVLLQAGFALLMGGSVSQGKSFARLLAQNLLLGCASLLGFFVFGYGFAFGRYGHGINNPYVGAGIFSCSNAGGEKRWDHFLQHWVIASAAGAILTGCLGERITLAARFGEAFHMASFTYPVVAHWALDSSGWLFPFGKKSLLGIGAVNLTGLGSVHVLGGFAGLIGAVIIRHQPHDWTQKRAHITQSIVGSIVLWFGWFIAITSNGANFGNTTQLAANRIAVVTTLSTAASGVTTFIIHSGRMQVLEDKLCLGFLAGLVATSAGSAVIEPAAGIVIGFIGAVVMWLGQLFMKQFGLIDPLGVIALHCTVGAWGILSLGVFARPTYIMDAFTGGEQVAHPEDCSGIFYGGNGLLLATQCISLLAIMAWATLQFFPFFKLTHLVESLVPNEDENEDEEFKHIVK